MSTQRRHTIAHFSDSETFGGTERALLHLLAHLDRDRWRPVLFHPDDPGAAQLADEARDLGVTLRPFALPRSAARGVAGIPALARALRHERAAVFHAHQTWSLSCRYAIVAARIARVPAIVASAQLFVELPPLRGIELQHAVLTHCVHRHVAVSRHVASRLRARFGVDDAKIAVIPNAVIPHAMVAAASESGDPPLRERLGAGERAIVLTVARLDAQKGISVLLRAAADVPHAIFVIAGEGPEHEALEMLARSLGIAARVHFLGHRRDIPALLAACDVFVLPSLYEGLPLSVLEAMASGIPVVATAIGGTDEVIRDGETGLLVPPGDAPALATAIAAVLADPAAARTRAAAARAYVCEHHSAAGMARRMSALYEELLAP